MKEFTEAVLLARDKGMIDNKEARELIRRKFNLFDRSDPLVDICKISKDK